MVFSKRRNIMNYSQFINNHINKAMDYDGSSGVQCVDLIKYYLDEVFNITPGSWGDAKNYYENYNSLPALKNNFTRIANSASFIPQKGDIVVWGANVSSSHNCGHIAIATGEGTTSYFYSHDQNWGEKACHKVKHTYTAFLGVLRAKDQSKINGSGGEVFPTPLIWANGSTSETMYSRNDFKNVIMTLNPRATAHCYSRAGNAYLIVATRDGGKHATAGFVAYNGGISYAPPESKTWTNGSTSETVYADVDKTIVVGSLNPRETAYCLAIRNGMYLVLYKLDNSEVQKCGFVEYSGGVS